MTERADIGDGGDSEEEYAVDMNKERANFTPQLLQQLAVLQSSVLVQIQQTAAMFVPSGKLGYYLDTSWT